jgi:hypothetical protein
MTEGIPARSSIELLISDEAIPSLKYSPRNMEIESENGIEIMSERNDVIKVPTKKDIEPNSLDTGSHVLP